MRINEVTLVFEPRQADPEFYTPFSGFVRHSLEILRNSTISNRLRPGAIRQRQVQDLIHIIVSRRNDAARMPVQRQLFRLSKLRPPCPDLGTCGGKVGAMSGGDATKAIVKEPCTERALSKEAAIAARRQRRAPKQPGLQQYGLNNGNTLAQQ